MIDNKHSTGMALHSRMLAINLQHLRYAVAARDQGSLSTGGRKPISSAIDVEPVHSPAGAFDWHDYLQAIEWWRSATNAGRDFLHLARSILEQVDSLVTRAHRTGRGEAGRLTIGFYTSLTAGNLRATLVDYARRFPELELGMIEGSRTRLVTALRNGAVDIAIVTGETHLPHTKSMSL